MTYSSMINSWLSMHNSLFNAIYQSSMQFVIPKVSVGLLNQQVSGVGFSGVVKPAGFKGLVQ